MTCSPSPEQLQHVAGAVKGPESIAVLQKAVAVDQRNGKDGPAAAASQTTQAQAAR